jgi:hypothetical protein
VRIAKGRENRHMNAITQPRAQAASPRALSNAELGAELLREVQLSRAQAMALTRLHFALASGNRHQAMEAMDRLHALDAEAERLAARLPAASEDDDEAAAVARHLADQKLAIAFEKLALASSISGPGMVSRAGTVEEAMLILDKPIALAEPANDANYAEPPLADWPALPRVEPTEWRPIVSRPLRAWLAFGLLAALLVLLAGLLMAAAI